MFSSPYLMFTIQLVVHICWKKYLLELQEAISREACVSMQSWGKLWVSQNHSSLFDVPRKTQNGLMCRANCKMAWCAAQIISGHYSAMGMGEIVSGNYLRAASTILSFARHIKKTRVILRHSKTLSTLNWDISLVQIVAFASFRHVSFPQTCSTDSCLEL